MANLQFRYLLVSFAAVFAMSSGGVLFGLMLDTPVWMRVAWRLSIAAALQSVGFARDWRAADAALRARWFAAVPLQVLNGCILAVHFWSFAASIEYTSYANSMLIVSCVPMVFVAQALCAWALGVALRRAVARGGGGGGGGGEEGGGGRGKVGALHRSESGVALHSDGGAAAGGCDGQGGADAAAAAAPATPPSAAHASLAARALAVLRGASTDALAPLPPMPMEVLGACTALSGVAALVMLTSREGAASGASRYIRAPSLAGDLAAVFSALCMAVYLSIGRSQRAWMPLWMYACPVTAVAAAVAAAVSLAAEPGTSAGAAGDAALFGWLASPRSAVLALAAGVVPTILGHSMANLALGHVHPLTISVVQLLQPIIGSIYAFFLGIAGPPSAVVALAAPLILGGIALVVTGSRGSPCPLPAACGGAPPRQHLQLRDADVAGPRAEGGAAEEGVGAAQGGAGHAPRRGAGVTDADSAWHSATSVAGGGVVWMT